MTVSEISLQDEKYYICNTILRALPDWFGIESAIVDYVQEAQNLPFFAAIEEKKAVGFAALKIHNEFTAEIYVTGVLPDYHRKGIGKNIVQKCEEYCRSSGFKFLTVKTLAASSNNEAYSKTLKFYQNIGFIPLEVFPLLWDKANPCLFLAKSIAV
jgi:ribosomal protein S18 acetylase RimI-like enzyme